MGCSINDVLHLIEEKTRLRTTNPIEGALADVEVKGLPNHTILVRPDGAEIPIEDSAAPIKNPEGEDHWRGYGIPRRDRAPPEREGAAGGICDHRALARNRRFDLD